MKHTIAILALLAAAGCYAPKRITVDTRNAASYSPHVLRYYYDNQYTIIPERAVYILEEAQVDTIVVFTNTPKKFHTAVVLPPSELLTFAERDSIIKRALDYVLKDKRHP